MYFQEGPLLQINVHLRKNVCSPGLARVVPFERLPMPLTLLFFVFMLFSITSCGIPRVFLEAVPSDYDENATEPTLPPLRINYFFDRTFSMRGFSEVLDSAYIRTIPLLWRVGDSLWPTVESAYYVYGTVQIGRTSRAELASMQDGLRVPRFYGDGPNRGSFVRQAIPRRPFYALYHYVHDTIHPSAWARSLSVIVTDLYEADDPAVFSRFFQTAFAKNLSGAFFAVESEFDGVVWDVRGYTPQGVPVPFPWWGQTTGRTMSTFFILILGNSVAVEHYSKRLHSELTASEIAFNHAVFIMDGREFSMPVERVYHTTGTDGQPNMITVHTTARDIFSAVPQEISFPETGNFLTIPNIARFESQDARFSMVNLRALNNRQLGIFRWLDDGTSVPASVEAYQIMGRIGSRYSALLGITALAGDAFVYRVNGQVYFHPGERRNLSLGEVSEFRPFAAQENHFELRVEPDPFAAQNGGFFQGLRITIEIRNLDALPAGFYKVRYTVNSHALMPEWVIEKSADTIGAFEAMHERVDSVGMRVGLGVLGLRSVYSDIITAYTHSRFNRHWQGEVYFVRR